MVKKILRKHRIVESFLTKLGFPKHKLHEEACKLEHSISDVLERTLDRNIGFPEECSTGKEILETEKFWLWHLLILVKKEGLQM
ncbi:MAG: iron dependent repressor, metal binding and dimerization domain protein [Candidatus Thermoplasmatota archaeon]|nr:iron dependent repressor, metal binding and dimerization domain protein [Candidatus Thermoplasmatota archaeon]